MISIGYYLFTLFLLGLVALITSKKLGKWAGWLYATVPLYGVVYFFTLLPDVDRSVAVIESYPWIPQYGINFSIYVDGLSEFFSLLVLGIGTLILIYAAYYSKAYPRKEFFMGYLILFMAAMLGLVVAGNLITFFLFWELTSIFSYLLIGFDHEKENARKGAMQALLITVLGGQALLVGFVLIGMVYHGYELTTIFSSPELLQNSSFYFPVLILVVMGAFTKSAQFPFHFWLPDAMVAPTPVSAYLHSATMVKAGIFLLLRFNSVLGGTESWHYILSVFGVTTMFIGAWISLTQTDLKRILAYSTISALGTIVLLIGTDTEYAINAAIIFILVHALYKGTLFMLAGVIQKQTGTREISELGGLFYYMPFAAVVMCLALVSMAGIPPMLGFISKELIYEAKVHAPSAYWLILPAGIMTNVIMVFLSLRLSIDVFWGKRGNYTKHPQEPALSMILGPLFLVSISLILGIFPESFANPLTAQAIKDINFKFNVMELKLWPGWNLVQGISVLTIIMGVILFNKRSQVIRLAKGIEIKYFPSKFSCLFFHFIDLFLSWTNKKTQVIQHGYNRLYLITIFSVSSVLIWFYIWYVGLVIVAPSFDQLSISLVFIILLIIMAVFNAVMTSSRAIALVSMGVLGFGIILIFIAFSGVDLPITMIMAEVIMIIFSTALLFYFPHYVNRSSRGEYLRDVVIATTIGASITVFVLQAGTVNFIEPISNFYKEVSLSEAFGRNIVNVILVDFRALDTLGEITVLSIAALGIFFLMAERSGMASRGEDSLILRIAAKYLRPLLIALSLAVLFRGHQEPGGGFIGGLMLGAAVILYAMAYGVNKTRKTAVLNPLVMIGVGLSLSILSGMPAVLAGQPYMKGEWITLVSGLKFGTPILFDLGVYLTVAGMLIQAAFSVMED